MNCPNCGAPLRSDERLCQFCGSENPGYLVNDTGIRLRVEKMQADDVRIRAYARVPVEAFRLSRADIEKMVCSQLVRQIAEQIVEKKGYRFVSGQSDQSGDPFGSISVMCEVTVRDYNAMEVSVT